MPIDTSFDIILIINIFCALIALSILFIFLSRRGRIRSAFIYCAIIIFAVLITTLNYYFDNKLIILKTIMDYAVVLFLVIFVVVNQSTIKSISASFNKPRSLDQSLMGFVSTDEELSNAARDIVRAVQNMAKNDVGALIIIARKTLPEYILNSGTSMNAMLSAPLIESIFNKKSPLHDGAIIVRENRILSAGCFLPLSHDTNISKDLGTRHRAALGISEESDALCIVVSEETGIISTVVESQLKRYLTPEKLLDTIEKAYNISYKLAKPSRTHTHKKKI